MFKDNAMKSPGKEGGLVHNSIRQSDENVSFTDAYCKCTKKYETISWRRKMMRYGVGRERERVIPERCWLKATLVG